MSPDDEYYTPEELMELMLSKYLCLTEKGEWNKETADQQRITALEAQLKKVSKGPKTPPRNRGTKKNRQQKKNGKKKNTSKDDDPDWFKNHIPPKHHERFKKRIHNGKEYRWCHEDTGGKCPGRWVRHAKADCKWQEIQEKRKAKKQKRQSDGNNDDATEMSKKAKKARIASSVKAMFTQLQNINSEVEHEHGKEGSDTESE